MYTEIKRDPLPQGVADLQEEHYEIFRNEGNNSYLESNIKYKYGVEGLGGIVELAPGLGTPQEAAWSDPV